MLGKVAEVGVSCNQRKIVIDAGLADERVRQSRAKFLRQHFGAGISSAYPITFKNIEHSDFHNKPAVLRWQEEIRENLRQHDRQQHDTACLQAADEPAD